MAEMRDVVPRDDRAWPRSSTAWSLVLGLVALIAGGLLVHAAVGRGVVAVALTVVGFLAALGLGYVAFASGTRRWLAGYPVPAHSQTLPMVGLVGAFVVAATYDGAVGGAIFCGLMCGLLVANVLAIRAARANRGAVDRAEAALAASLEGEAEDRGLHRPEYVGAGPPIGHQLRQASDEARRRWLAWLLAATTATVVCAGFDLGEPLVFGIVTMGGLMAALSTRTVVAAWLASRDFARAATPPRRAFVVLLNDPNPRVVRPLLGIWSEAPTPREGRFPRPDQVYRADDDRIDLLSFQGSVVVHEAWVDTGRPHRSKPRWVAADKGIALPHRRALLGRAYMGSLIRGERPGRPRPLMTPVPDPSREGVVSGPDSRPSLVLAVASRVAGLAAFGLLLWLIT